MRTGYLCLLSAGLLLSSCSLQKRLYRPGFYIATQRHSTFHKKETPLELNRHEVILSSAPVTKPVLVAKPLPPSEHRSPVVHKAQAPQAQEAVGLRKSKDERPESGPISNDVAKASFRLMLISFFLLSAAWFCFFTFPELAYVTFIILIATLVYALVSLITAVNARKDTINNTRKWLKVAFLALVMSVLIICLTGLLIILLF